MWLVKDELRKLKNKAIGGGLHWLNDEIDNIEQTAAIGDQRTLIRPSPRKYSIIP
jgi:hypothetical protein